MSQQPISPMNLFVLQRDSADNIANEMLLAGRFGNSEYGRSKKAGEELFFDYAK